MNNLNIDDPALILAVLALLVGVRLALYVIGRMMQTETPSPAPTLSPDDGAEDTLILHTPVAEAAGLTSGGVTLDARQSTTHAAAREKADAPPFQVVTEILDSFVIAIAIVFFLIRPFVLQAFYIPSESMVPTLLKQDKLLATKYNYRVGEPRRGDVVVFHAPAAALDPLQRADLARGHTTEFVKRVIGLPGERIRIVDNQGVYINGQLLSEPYVQALPDYDFPVSPDGGINIMDEEVRTALYPQIRGEELVIPPDCYFVMGDNRQQSKDSHMWGFVPREALVGKAAFIFWPTERIGWVK